MALKVDIQKAFDTMHWDFILHVLESLGFIEHFCNMIFSILNSARLSISLNGQLEGYFSCSRGARQGNRLSPLLFAIGEDVLAKMFNYCGGIRWLIRAEAKLNVRLPLSLLYADDILVFCKATRENVLMLSDIFDQYGNTSGQVVGPAKSRVVFGK